MFSVFKKPPVTEAVVSGRIYTDYRRHIPIVNGHDSGWDSRFNYAREIMAQMGIKPLTSE